MMKPYEPQSMRKILLIVLMGLMAPSVCFGSDMTGALVYFVGGLLLLCLVIGIVAAAILKFAFKRSNKVWFLIPAIPALAIAGLAFWFHQQQDRKLHAGPDIEFSGSHSVTVSKKFGEAELDRAYSRIQAPRFKSELSQYTRDPVSHFVFAIELTIQPNADTRRYVCISTEPQVHVNTPTYEAIMFLFSKAVIESDPMPSTEFYTEPPKLLAQ